MESWRQSEKSECQLSQLSSDGRCLFIRFVELRLRIVAPPVRSLSHKSHAGLRLLQFKAEMARPAVPDGQVMVTLTLEPAECACCHFGALLSSIFTVAVPYTLPSHLHEQSIAPELAFTATVVFPPANKVFYCHEVCSVSTVCRTVATFRTGAVQTSVVSASTLLLLDFVPLCASPLCALTVTLRCSEARNSRTTASAAAASSQWSSKS